jgi:hypothetical protein
MACLKKEEEKIILGMPVAISPRFLLLSTLYLNMEGKSTYKHRYVLFLGKCENVTLKIREGQKLTV